MIGNHKDAEELYSEEVTDEYIQYTKIDSNGFLQIRYDFNDGLSIVETSKRIYIDGRILKSRILKDDFYNRYKKIQHEFM